MLDPYKAGHSQRGSGFIVCKHQQCCAFVCHLQGVLCELASFKARTYLNRKKIPRLSCCDVTSLNHFADVLLLDNIVCVNRKWERGSAVIKSGLREGLFVTCLLQAESETSFSSKQTRKSPETRVNPVMFSLGLTLDSFEIKASVQMSCQRNLVHLML